MAMRYYQSLLTENERSIYESIRQQLQQFAKDVSIPMGDEKEITRAYEALHNDTPELFFLEISYVIQKAPHFCSLKLNWMYSPAEAAQLLNQLNAVSDRVTAAVRTMTERQAAEYIHDYLVRTVTYATDTNAREAHTIVGALLRKTCVCEGYAKAYKFLCNRAGIKGIVVRGGAIEEGDHANHMWNIVTIDKQRYYVDTTFDSFVDNQYCSKAFLFLSDSDLRHTHKAASDFALPPCPNSLCPLVRVNSLDGVVRAMAADSGRGVTHSEYILETGYDLHKLGDDLYEKAECYDRRLVRRIKGLFLPETKTVRVIGVAWR